MKTVMVLVFLLAMMAAREGFGAAPAEIELTDGSIIRAEVISLQDDRYTFHSETVGTISVEKSRVKSIRTGPGDRTASPSSAALNTAEQIKALNEAMMSDQTIMDKVSSLSQDPDVMRVMDDPELMKAINAGDIVSLMSNEKFKQILNNPAVQEVVKKMSP